MALRFKKITKYKFLSDIQLPKSFILFYGKSLDERGFEILKHIKKVESVTINYDNAQDGFYINDEFVRRAKFNIESYIKTYSTIVIEATTLGYVEIITLLYFLNRIEKFVDILFIYVEPLSYRKVEKNLFEDEYELSDDWSKNYKYIKPFIFQTFDDSILNKQATLITILGFEEGRLGRIIESNTTIDYKYDEFISIITIPGFKVGWENVSLSKHYNLLENVKELYYTPADNPYETYKTLNRIVDNLYKKRVVIMPIGTKPCTIGAAIFMVNHTEKKSTTSSDYIDVATKYDFPIKKENRTNGIGNVFIYSLTN